MAVMNPVLSVHISFSKYRSLNCYFSDKFTRLYGWSKSEIIGRSAILDFMFCEETELLFIQSIKDALEKNAADFVSY